MYQVDAIRTDRLTHEDRARWIAALADADFVSPLLHPDFTVLVGTTRADARILIATDKAARKAFLPIHKLAFGFARPIGSVFSDYHGLIAEPAFRGNISSVLAGAGLRAFRYFSLVNSRADSPHEGAYADASISDLTTLVQDNSASRAKTLRRLDRKLEREVGDVVLEIGDTDTAAYAQLLHWKSQQFIATARHDVLGVSWARKMLDTLQTCQTGDLTGCLVTLRAGDHLVAAEFGPRWNGIFHPWIAAYDSDYAAYSPGNILVKRLLDNMQQNGLHRYDLGPADAGYKSGFANGTVALAEGSLRAKGQRLTPRLTSGSHLVNKVARRWEQILLSEPTVKGRLTGAALAAASLMRS
ncbi:GNAT family N-acetyltransferase [Hyphobacterium sp.]|uniref:GNAT family N-acetyltransferase n=1 Tax=Hyphobacterium sp. TaxID=2004662 RepID=UPI0037487109